MTLRPMVTDIQLAIRGLLTVPQIAPYPSILHYINQDIVADHHLPAMSLSQCSTVFPNACLYESDSERVTSQHGSSCSTIGELDFFLQIDQDSEIDSRTRPWEKHKRQNPTIKKGRTMIKCIDTNVYGECEDDSVVAPFHD